MQPSKRWSNGLLLEFRQRGSLEDVLVDLVVSRRTAEHLVEAFPGR